MKKSIFLGSGGFDPIYFFYDEDTDLSLRVQNLGYKNYVYKSSIPTYLGSSIRTSNSRYFNKVTWF